jgi:NAD(P)-dependent dehydrogenase (short-subunit alcohol dehydrogenase family)
MGRLEGKVAIVTGAGSGIGRAIALGFAREGARVAAVDLNGQTAEETAGLASPGTVMPLVADVAESEPVRSMVERVVAWAPFGRGQLDVLVNNAAVQLVGRDARCHELDEATWDATIRVNLRGPFLCCKHALPALIRSGGGSIVNLGSPTAYRGLGSGYTAYASSKGGVHTLTRLLAHDYAADGIRVNAIVPGPTETNLTARIFADEAVRGRLLAETPLGRLGQPEDLVPLAIFLASDESAYATGGLFFVDGGITMA